jgi:hypothetical protein
MAISGITGGITPIPPQESGEMACAKQKSPTLSISSGLNPPSSLHKQSPTPCGPRLKTSLSGVALHYSTAKLSHGPGVLGLVGG